jgi:WD40 repeat protein
VRIWDSDSGEELLQLRGHTAPIGFLTYSRDGLRLATAGDTSARLWDVTADGLTLPVFRPSGGKVHDAEYHPDGKQLIIAGTQKDTVVWDPDTGKRFTLHVQRMLKLLTLPAALFGDVVGVRSSPDGRRVLTLSADEPASLSLDPRGGLVEPVPHQPVRLWDGNTGRALLALEGHTDKVQKAVFSGDSSRILTIS